MSTEKKKLVHIRFEVFDNPKDSVYKYCANLTPENICLFESILDSFGFTLYDMYNVKNKISKEELEK